MGMCSLGHVTRSARVHRRPFCAPRVCKSTILTYRVCAHIRYRLRLTLSYNTQKDVGLLILLIFYFREDTGFPMRVDELRKLTTQVCLCLECFFIVFLAT